jgi:beta-glucosidase
MRQASVIYTKLLLSGLILGLVILNLSSCKNRKATYLDLNNNGRMDVYENPNINAKSRAIDLVNRLHPEEKIKLMGSNSSAIKRLGIPAFGWDNEGKHAIVTCFPASIGLAATWNDSLIFHIGDALGDEARIMSKKEVEQGKKLKWLSFWAPTINMARDPRWGRTMESYGEDPWLQSRIAISFIKGFQGENLKYIKAVAGINHFAVYNRELGRHKLNAVVKDEKTLREYYLASFEQCVKIAHNNGVGSSNNAVNGVPSCVNRWLLTNILRQEWGFTGYIFSDAGSLSDVAGIRHYASSNPQAMAMALKAGLDIDCGRAYQTYLGESLDNGLVSENMIDSSLVRSLTVRFRMGMFDPSWMNPYNTLPDTLLDGKMHRALARRSADESIVLLKNHGNILPVNQSVSKIVVAGPSADIPQLGRKQQGHSAHNVSLFEGIKNCFPQAHVVNSPNIDHALAEAKNANLILYATSVKEGEVTDRFNLRLSGRQEEDIYRLVATHKPIVVVLFSGSMVDVTPWIDKVDGLIEAWYPGEEGGNALADIISGKINPSGKLPLTFYKSAEELPPFSDFDITKGRTYQYLKEQAQYPFGFGLSYTNFSLKVDKIKKNEDTIKVKMLLKNTGEKAGAEVVQLYVRYSGDGSRKFPIKRLRRFKKVWLKPEVEKEIVFKLMPDDFSFYDDKMNYKVFRGDYHLEIGNSSENIVDSSKIHFDHDLILQKGPKLICHDLHVPSTSLRSGEPFEVSFIAENQGDITGKLSLLVDGKALLLKDKYLGPHQSDTIHAMIKVYGKGIHPIGLDGQPAQKITIQPGKPDFLIEHEGVSRLGSIGQRINYGYDIFNQGSSAGTFYGRITIDGKKTTTVKTVFLKPGESGKLRFSHIFTTSGSHKVSLNGENSTQTIIGHGVNGPYRLFFNSQGHIAQIDSNSFWASCSGSVGGSPVANNNGVRTASDRYGVVYLAGKMTANSVATLRVLRQQGNVSNYAKVGIMIRNHINEPGKSIGYCTASVDAYYGGGGLFEWDANGDGFLDSISTFSLAPYPNKWIRIEKHRTTFIIWNSSDGVHWRKQTEKDIPSAKEVQDVGVFVTSDRPGKQCKVIFSGFTVQSIKGYLKENDRSEIRKRADSFTTEPL